MSHKSKQLSAISDIQFKVLFGFKKDKPELTGYFGENCQIVENVEDAKFFPVNNRVGKVGFGTPFEWQELVNSDSDLNHGYKFHLVSYSRNLSRHKKTAN